MPEQEFKIYLRGLVNERVLHFISEHFLAEHNCANPTLEQIAKIPFDSIEQSWLSIPSQKELLLIQQNL